MLSPNSDFGKIRGEGVVKDKDGKILSHISIEIPLTAEQQEEVEKITGEDDGSNISNDSP